MAEGLTQRRLSQALTVLADVQLELDHERLARARADALLERLFGSLSDGVLVTDPHGRVLRANRAAQELFGRGTDELVGAFVRELYRDEIPETPWAMLDADPSGRLSMETSTVAPDGSERPIGLSCAIVRDGDGRMQGAVHAARDLTEAQRLLREVEAAEARWRLLAAVSNHLAGALDPRDALDAIVKALERETGCGAAVVLSREGVVRHVVVSPAAPDRTALASLEGAVLPAESALATVIRSRQLIHAATMEPGFPLIGSDAGSLRSAVVLPLADEDLRGGALLIVAARPGAVDTETVALMEEVAARMSLSLANAALRDTLLEQGAAEGAAQYRNEILAAISHDMKTPLSVLIGMVPLLDKPLPDAAKTEIHTSIQRQVRRLRRLVTQFLDYIHLEAGHDLSVAPVPTDLADVLAPAMDVAEGTERVRVDAPTPLPWVVADASRTELALTNLLSNAMKYATGSTPITVSVRVVGRHVEICVADVGPGISPADQSRIFERFQRGARDTGTEGTGLGLYMTRQLMRSQGGEVRVASELGVGSQFTLVLPRAHREAE